ncbi:hypothetical protein KRP22_006275 [Phytophthora ramorum]|nr:hypothetical protein KRP22_2593 [Phytophthora ramorum]
MQLDDVKTVHASVCAGPIRSIATHRRENLEQAAVLADACIEEVASAEQFPERYLDGSIHQVWEGVPSLGKMKRSLMGRFVLKAFMQDELEAMKDMRSDVEKSVLEDEEAFGVASWHTRIRLAILYRNSHWSLAWPSSSRLASFPMFDTPPPVMWRQLDEGNYR